MVFESGSGHPSDRLTSAAGTLVMFAMIALGMSTLYFLYSVYIDGEYFSDAWERAKGKSKWTIRDEQLAGQKANAAPGFSDVEHTKEALQRASFYD